MKTLVLLLTLLFTVPAFSIEVGDRIDCDECTDEPSQETKKMDFKGLETLYHLKRSDYILRLSNHICAIFSGDVEKISDNALSAIRIYMQKYENPAPPTTTQIVNFLNQNKNRMTCGKDNKHYMIVALEDASSYDELFNVLFYDQLLTEDDSVFVDVNIISYSGPPTRREPESVLDFMQRSISDKAYDDSKLKDFEELIDFFKEALEAKNAKEILIEERNKLRKD